MTYTYKTLNWQLSQAEKLVFAWMQGLQRLKLMTAKSEVLDGPQNQELARLARKNSSTRKNLFNSSSMRSIACYD